MEPDLAAAAKDPLVPAEGETLTDVILGPLSLAWIAGNGKLESKAKKYPAYRYQVQTADIVMMKSLILKLIPSLEENWNTFYGLNKVSLLMKGLMTISKLKIEMMCRRFEAYEERIKTPLNDEFGLKIISIPTVTTELVNLSFDEQGFGVMDFSYAPDMAQQASGIEPIGNEVDEILHTHTTGIQNASGRTHKMRKRVMNENDNARTSPKRRRPCEYPDSEYILNKLKEQAENLDPFAHTILDPILPAQPVMENSDFADPNEDNRSFEYFRTIQNILTSDETCTSLTAIRGEQSPSIKEKDSTAVPQRPQKSTEDIKDNDVNKVLLLAFQGSPGTLAIKPKVICRRRRKNMKFKDEQTKISDNEIYAQLAATKLDDWTKSTLDPRNPLWFTVAMPIRMRTLQWTKCKDKAGFRQNFRTEYPCKFGMELIKVAVGRELIGVQLNKFLNTRTPFYVEKKIRKPGKEKDKKKTEATRLESSGSTMVFSNDVFQGDPPSSEFSALFGQEYVDLSSALAVEISAPSPVQLQSIAELAGPQMLSPQPELKESAGRTFKELVPAGKSRRHACHMFVKFMDLRREGKIRVEQSEPFGTIQIFTKMN